MQDQTNLKPTALSPEEILKLAQLSNIRLSDDELELYQRQVADILGMLNELSEIDTDGIEPTYQVSGNLNVTREDKIEPADVAYGNLLALAPDSQDSQVKVKKVL